MLSATKSGSPTDMKQRVGNLTSSVLLILFNVMGSNNHRDHMSRYRSVEMEESEKTPETSKAATKASAAAARKVKAKQTSALAILKKDTGIVESARESRVGFSCFIQNQYFFDEKVIFVCNAGLTTSTTNSDLVRIFSKVSSEKLGFIFRPQPTCSPQYGPIESVVMVPKKSYSFLVFARWVYWSS